MKEEQRKRLAWQWWGLNSDIVGKCNAIYPLSHCMRFVIKIVELLDKVGQSESWLI